MLKKIIFLFSIVVFIPSLIFAQIIFSEIMFDPEGADSGYEWIEIKNNSNSSINLEDYNFCDGAPGCHRWAKTGNSNFLLEKKSFAIITDDKEKFLERNNFSGLILISTGFSLTNTTGRTLKIRNNNKIFIDSILYNPSLGGKGGETLSLDNSVWKNSTASPGKENFSTPSQTESTPATEPIPIVEKIIIENNIEKNIEEEIEVSESDEQIVKRGEILTAPIENVAEEKIIKKEEDSFLNNKIFSLQKNLEDKEKKILLLNSKISDLEKKLKNNSEKNKILDEKILKLTDASEIVLDGADSFEKIPKEFFQEIKIQKTEDFIKNSWPFLLFIFILCGLIISILYLRKTENEKKEMEGFASQNPPLKDEVDSYEITEIK